MTATASLALAAVAAAVVLAVAARLAPALTSPTRLPIPPAARRPLAVGLPGRRRRRAGADEELALAAWCERVAGGVRAGGSLSQSVVEAERALPSPFDDAVHAIRRGRPLGAAFDDRAGDAASPAGLVAPVVAACAEVGGPAAGALERVASVLAARATERDERRVASAQATLSARVLTVVPIGVIGLLAVGEPSIRAILVTPAGATCLTAGTLLDLAGWRWMRHLIGATA